MLSLLVSRSKRRLTTAANRGHNEAMNFWMFLDRNGWLVIIVLFLLIIPITSLTTRSNVASPQNGCRVNVGDQCAQCRTLDAGAP